MVNVGKYTIPMDPMGMKFSTLQGIKRRWCKDFKPEDSNQLEWLYTPPKGENQTKTGFWTHQVFHNSTPSKAFQVQISKVFQVHSNEAPSSMEVWIHPCRFSNLKESSLQGGSYFENTNEWDWWCFWKGRGTVHEENGSSPVDFKKKWFNNLTQLP